MLTISSNGSAEANCPTGNAPSRGRMAGAMQLAVAPPTQSGRARTAALNVLSTMGDAVFCRRPS